MKGHCSIILDYTQLHVSHPNGLWFVSFSSMYHVLCLSFISLLCLLVFCSYYYFVLSVQNFLYFCLFGVADVDECSVGLHNCSIQTSSCVDQLGGFTCKCRPGYQRQGHICQGMGLIGAIWMKFVVGKCYMLVLATRPRSAKSLSLKNCLNMAKRQTPFLELSLPPNHDW